MCGIAAAVDLRGAGRAQPWAGQALAHRGPDGRGTWCSPDRNVVLEHTRLAIIDPHNREADQPFSDPTGRWVLTYNGEIFNFRELRTELEQLGERFRTQSDTEVLLAAYLRWGAEVLPRLRGMFAFAVADRQTGDLFAARDQLGVKPLYWLEHDGMLALCSEVRPLLRHPGFRPRLDPPGVVEFLAFGKSPGERTIVSGLRKLLPGTALTVSGGRAEISRYWDLLPPEPGNADPHEEIVPRLEEAVDLALVSDVPVGLMLSAGLDSSLVATLAARGGGPPLTAYSVAFGQPEDEVGAAARLASDLGIRFREVRVSEQEVTDAFEPWLDGIDYPSGNPTWMASWFIARAARDDGVPVLLTGDGGDELFGGYDRWMKYLRFHDRVWRRVPGAARRVAGRVARPGTSGLAADIARRAAAGGELFVTSRPFHDDALAACLGPRGRTAMEAVPPETVTEELRERFDGLHPGGDYLAWMSYVATRTSLVEDFLQRLDKMGMQHSVEGRVPLLDPRVARWAVGLPQDVRLRDGEPKALIRTAARRLLPDYILERPKRGFCAPVGAWTESLMLQRLTLEGPLVDDGLLAPDAPARLKAHGAFATWTLASLADWCERNLVAAPAPAAA